MLELVATLSVALVAVVVGVRLAEGHLSLSTALVVLLLAPEAYWPLRRMGAEFHAAAEGVATFEAVAALDADEDPTPADVVDAAAADAALVIADLTVVHPGRTMPALDGVSAVVPARGVTALTGPVGVRQVDAAGRDRRAGAAGGAAPSPPAVARWAATPGARRSPGCRSDRSSCPGPSPTTCASAPPTPTTRGCGTPCAGSRSRSACSRLPRGLDEPVGEDGTTAVGRASAPAWRWRGCSSTTGRGCCSTSRPPTSTRSPR